MTQEADNIITFMIKELSSLKYCYRDIIEGCYTAALRYRNYVEPKEGKDFVVDKVTEVFGEVRPGKMFEVDELHIHRVHYIKEINKLT